MTELERARVEADLAAEVADRAVAHALNDRNEWSAWLARAALSVAERRRAVSDELRRQAEARANERQVRLPYAEAS